MKHEKIHTDKRKKIILIAMVLAWTILMLCFFVNTSTSQPKSEKKVKKTVSYNVWISQYKKPFASRHKAVEFKDFEVVVRAGEYGLKRKKILTKNIKSISIVNKSKFEKSILIGSTIGVLFGGIYGYSQGNSEVCVLGIGTTKVNCLAPVSINKQDKALLNGFIFGVTGTIIGAIAGREKIKILLNGNKEKYKSRRKELEGYLPK